MKSELVEAFKAANVDKKYRRKVKERLAVLEYAADNGGNWSEEFV